MAAKFSQIDSGAWKQFKYAGRDFQREYLNRDKTTLQKYWREYYIRKKEQKAKKSGIVSRRDVRKESEVDYNRDYYLRNKESWKGSNHGYYSDNFRERVNYFRKYYDRNVENKCDSNSDYNELNRETRRISNRVNYVKALRNPTSYCPRDSMIKSWKTRERIREYLGSLGKQLFISQFTDWYRISRAQICHLGGM